MEERKATRVVKVAPVKHPAKDPEATSEEKKAAKAMRLDTFNKQI